MTEIDDAPCGVERTWGLGSIRVAEEAPRLLTPRVLRPEPPPIAIDGSITFRRTYHWGPDLVESHRAAGTLEGVREHLRRDVWRDVHAGLADELRLALADLPNAGPRLAALIEHLEGKV